MTVVVEDLITGNRLHRDENGRTHERVFLVSEVTGPAHARASNALEGDRRIPVWGAPHPSIPGLTVVGQDVEPDPQSTSTFRVTITYAVAKESEKATSETGSGELDLTAIVSSETTTRDIFGNSMIVNYSGRPDLLYVDGEWQRGRLYTRAVRTIVADVERPQLRATIRKRSSTPLIDLAAEFTGKINAGNWSGFPEKTWLCSGIRQTRDGDGFMGFHDFVYARETWVLRAEIDLGTSRAIDATLGNGLEFFDVYETADFARLGVAIR